MSYINYLIVTALYRCQNKFLANILNARSVINMFGYLSYYGLWTVNLTCLRTQFGLASQTRVRRELGWRKFFSLLELLKCLYHKVISSPQTFHKKTYKYLFFGKLLVHKYLPTLTTESTRYVPLTVQEAFNSLRYAYIKTIKWHFMTFPYTGPDWYPHYVHSLPKIDYSSESSLYSFIYYKGFYWLHTMANRYLITRWYRIWWSFHA